MGVLRRVFYKKEFVYDKFNKKYPFNIEKQLKGYVKSFGEKNPDKTFYVIWRDYLGSGFFSNFVQVLAHMKAAYDLGMTPVVDFKNFKTLYNEKTPVNGTENAWEYYFKQVSPYSLEEVYESKRVFFCNGITPTPEFFNGLSTEEILNKYRGETYKDFFEKHIHLQDDVKKELEKYSHFFNQRVLGVHFRGKEMNIAQLHPFGPTVEQMFRYVDEIIIKYEIEKIFMVTEEKDYLDLFIARYGDKVIYSDAFRVAKVNAYNLINPRPHHRYLLGMEVLIDSLLLAKCNGLLYSNSGPSVNAAKMGDHEFTYCIDNGSNFRKWYLAKYAYRIKKLLPKSFGGLLDKITTTHKS